jgi:phosphoribosylformylglycinamidine synthase
MNESTTAPQARPSVTTLCIEVIGRAEDATGEAALVRAGRQLGARGLRGGRVSRLHYLQGDLDETAVATLAETLLADPVTETWRIRDPQTAELPAGHHTVEVSFLPGVTDSAAANLVRTAHRLGLTGLQRAASGQRYVLTGDLDAADLARLASGLLANPVIQRTAIDRPLPPPFFPYDAADDTVETIPLREADDDALLAISQERRLALDLAEMQAIRAYYRDEGREATDVELETLAQTWSEHCVHKTFRAFIDYDGPPPGPNAAAAPQPQTVDGLLNTTLRAVTEALDKPWVRSAFVDNAGIVAFDDDFDLAFKVETHNHPSALEPFGGANTGVGGVVRDILGVSARPIANTDVLCFGPQDLPYEALPAGVLHPTRIAAGVVHGVEDYGNKLGIPTVNGAIVYHPGYTANPLVYCGCLGILPRDSHPTATQPGDLIVAIGGGTGRDGLRGATFSSMEMDTATSDIAGSAVQIGNPIEEKQVMEVVLRARDEGLYSGITDCGAGGFSSAVGEMGAEIGADVELENVDLKYPGLRPWEIWLSEAQERMVLAVPPGNLDRLQAICDGQDVTLTVLGTFAPSGRLRVTYGGRAVGDLSMAFLHDGLPRRRLSAVWRLPATVDDDPDDIPTGPDAAALLLALLAHPNIRSKEDVIRRYDHEVQGGGAVKPLVGPANDGPGDAAVLVPHGTQRAGAPLPGVALGNGLCPTYTAYDPYRMAWAAVDEALRNVVAVGADPDRVAILDNFCWGNPNLPDRLGALVRSAQGCHDAALAYETPFVSGKDSLNNEYTDENGRKQAIPGTLLISALAHVPDVAQTVTMDLKRAGNFLFAVGDTRPELGGSHYALVGGAVRPQHCAVPAPVDGALRRLRALHGAIRAGLVRAAHDCSEGGLGVALAEMCLAGQIGAEIEMRTVPVDPYYAYAADEAVLFSESLTRFVVEVRPEDAAAFSAVLGDVPHACIGVVGGAALRIHPRMPGAADPLLELPVAALRRAFGGGSEDVPARLAPTRSQPADSGRGTGLVARPRVLILHANGTNRDRDAALACELAGGAPEIVHVNQLAAGERRLGDYQMLVVPGGFSYGDDLGAGVLWAVDLGRRGDGGFGADLARFVAEGRPVLGICNGFQALVKAGLLPGGDGPRPVTLTHNASGHFECRWVTLAVNSRCPSLFTQGLEESILCPVAHGEGRLLARNAAALARLQADDLIALTYVTGAGEAGRYPANPNGSALDIAGLSNAAGNVLGLMPHPENHIFPWQHPRAQRGERGGLGLRLFVNGVNAC